MPLHIEVNGTTIAYPITGEVEWGGEATNFADQVASALGKLGLGSGTTASIVGTLTVAGNTTLSANLTVSGDSAITGNETVTGNLTVNGNTTLGNANTDTIAVTGIVNVNSGALYVNPTTNKVGINDATPSEALDVNGNVAITGNETIGGTLGVTGNTTLSGTLGVTGNTTLTGQMLSSDGTASLPGISFSSDTNTGIFRSASDQLDIVTNGDSRFRIESTGQIKAVYESTIGTDYNTSANLANGYLCRAWVNFDGTLSNTTGTYTRSGNTITCTISSHGLTTGQTANLQFTTGGATNGIYVVTVTNSNTFTVQDTVSGTITTSNVTMLSRMIRASGNVSSITDNGTGDYTVNFTTAMPDANYAICTTPCPSVGFSLSIGAWFIGVGTDGSGNIVNKTASSIGIRTAHASGGVAIDAVEINLGIFR